MMWNDGSWGASSWLLMSLMMLIFWGGLAVLVVWLVRGSRSNSTRPTGEQTATTARADEVLAERFARGEIDEAEFTRSRDVLHSTGGRA
jgi:putative membrane protein